MMTNNAHRVLYTTFGMKDSFENEMTQDENTYDRTR